MMDKNQLQMDKNITETDLIDHIDESPLEHIIETLPVPAENVNVSNEDAERKSIAHKLANVFMAIKNEKEETKELAQLLKNMWSNRGVYHQKK